MQSAGAQQCQKKSTSCHSSSISGLVVEYIVAIDVTRVRFPADASLWTSMVPENCRRGRVSENTISTAGAGLAQTHVSELCACWAAAPWTMGTVLSKGCYPHSIADSMPTECSSTFFYSLFQVIVFLRLGGVKHSYPE